jgi:GT2 family glycosyltransferase
MEGVGRAKNLAFKHLLDEGCDYIIIVEDDMLFKGNLFEQYIKAYKKTGIEHFMFAYHGPANKGLISGGIPQPRKVIDYGKNLQLALNEHCVGAVCFYTRNCLEEVGIFDEDYINAFEHVDHSFELSKRGLTTPYWWWPDIANSLDFVEEQACSEESSAIRPRDDWQDNIKKSWEYFEQKHNVGPTAVSNVDFSEVSNFLKIIKPKKKITFIVHYREDTDERVKNFHIVYDYYKAIYPNCEFVFVEDDSKQTIKHLVREEDKYIFYKNDEIYNKCIGYNIGLKEASSDLICFLDIDCLVSIDSLIKASRLVHKHDMVCVGYNGTALYLEHSLKSQLDNKQGIELFNFIESYIDKDNAHTGFRNKYYAVGNTEAVGGCLFGKKETFENINGFNPNFIGWGYEDNEIISRAGALDVKVASVGNTSSRWMLFHLPHEEEMVGIKDKNKHKFYKHNEEEVQKVESMNKEQLTEYIKSW